MLKKKYAVFTMDVEAFSDTECVANSAESVNLDLMDGFDEYIRILDKHGIKSTLFTVGSLAPKIIDKLKSSINNGHKLALHSYKHIAPMDVSEETFRNEIKKSKDMLKKLFNTDIVGFRAPYFSLDDKRLNILKELGFKYDSSHLDFLKARHTVTLNLKGFKEFSKGIFYDGNFFEFGLSKQKIFGKPYPISGGGYVRLSHWGFIKSVIKQYLKQNDYYVFYLHPFELTTQKIPFLKDLKPYDQYYLQYGITSYGKHIEQLILLLKKLGYSFVTFEELSEILHKTNAS
ncbi:MAG: polysaccharide deacetylase family protein [Clostridia bacterium]|nr:polysaccharide deacetylase family protein [Clostridia bacterium]